MTGICEAHEEDTSTSRRGHKAKIALKSSHRVDRRHDGSIETGIARIDDDDKACSDKTEESIRKESRSRIGLMSQLECCSSVFSGHGGEVPVLESSSIVVL